MKHLEAGIFLNIYWVYNKLNNHVFNGLNEDCEVILITSGYKDTLPQVYLLFPCRTFGGVIYYYYFPEAQDCAYTQ